MTTTHRITHFMLVSILLASCDILRHGPFKVIGWSPGEGYHADGSFSSIQMTFSSKPNHEDVESAFSLEADGVEVRGAFSWEGNTLSFLPYSSSAGPADYVLSLSEEAQDEDGVSLDAAFEGRFSTRIEGPRPDVTSTFPADGASLPSASGAVEVRFATAVDSAACAESISFSPSRVGYWAIDGSGRTATFTPAEGWPLADKTTVTVSADLRDRAGRKMGTDYRFTFRVGTDQGKPYLVEAVCLDELDAPVLTLAADAPNDAATTENAGWEGPWQLRLSFSEEVDLASVDSLLTVDGGPTVKRQTDADRSATVAYAFSERPTWGSRFAFRLAAGVADLNGNASSEGSILRIVADGPRSRPPRLVGIRVPLAPGAVGDREFTAFPVDAPYADFNIVDANDRYRLDVATATEIELYFELAQGASLDRYSIMEKFRASATNSALSFSITNVATDGFTVTPDALWPSPAFARCRVVGTLTNHTNAGVVTFTLATGLKDSAGNKTMAAVSLPLVK